MANGFHNNFIGPFIFAKLQNMFIKNLYLFNRVNKLSRHSYIDRIQEDY